MNYEIVTYIVASKKGEVPWYTISLVAYPSGPHSNERAIYAIAKTITIGDEEMRKARFRAEHTMMEVLGRPVNLGRFVQVSEWELLQILEAFEKMGGWQVMKARLTQQEFDTAAHIEWLRTHAMVMN